MILNYSDISFDSLGRPEQPVLLLKTIGGDAVGTIANAFDLKLSIKYSEPSEISFSVPAYVDGIPTPNYDKITGYKMIHTEKYGVYVIFNPSISGDGIEEVKSVKGYSIEKTLESKKFFLEEGTFNFWNPDAPEDTVLGRLLEVSNGWSAGYVSPSLIGRYRTFDQYDDTALSFAYNSAPEKYRCVFVFEPYQKKVNVYDVDDEVSPVGIYLSFENLVDSLEIEEKTEEIVTAMRPYGADELDIRQVNPIGSNWIYDLSWFLENGDISDTLAQKWNDWQADILANQELYRGLTALRASTTASIMTAKAKLAELNAKYDDLTNQQSVTIQAYAMETTDDGKAEQQAALDAINEQMIAAQNDIADVGHNITVLQENLDNEVYGYNTRIQQIVDELSFDSYFTEDEIAVLREFFIEQDMTEDTFIATDYDLDASGQTMSISSGTIGISGSPVARIDIDGQNTKYIYTAVNGRVTTTGVEDADGNQMTVSGDVIRGTIEYDYSTDKFVISLYVGNSQVGDSYVDNGVLTIAGTAASVVDNIVQVTENGIASYEGTSITFSAEDTALYFTSDISDFKRYAVEMELYEYAVKTLHDVATPNYEFSVDTGNFIFAQEFTPFREELALGRPLYLRTHGDHIVTPVLIEFELDFEKWDSLSLIFSNRFKRGDNVNTLKDMIESSYSASRSFEASKYTYHMASNQASKAADFMSGNLDAAVNTILGAKNQSVVINGAGIQVGGDDGYKIRIVDSMICMTDDDWQTAKLAIGRFATENGTYWGVNAELVAGNLIVGNNLIIENEDMTFSVDATGAYLENATMLMRDEESGGMILIDPACGIMAGVSTINDPLYTVDGIDISPDPFDEDDEFKDGVSFYLSLEDGTAYFKGEIDAESGKIGGWTIDDGKLYSGSGTAYVGLNSSGTENPLYAIWAGAESPSSAPFYVKRDGTLHATDGIFGGTLDAPTLSGNLQAATGVNEGWIDGCGIRVGPNASAPNGYNFYVDKSGNVSINGGGSISFGQLDSATQAMINDAIDTADDAAGDVYDLAKGRYTGAGTTFINGTSIHSPNIYGGMYHSDDGQTKLYLEDYDDTTVGIGGGMYIADSNGWILFQVKRDGYLAAQFYSMNHEFLLINTAGSIQPRGNWDFS